jgi:hypothetical protein
MPIAQREPTSKSTSRNDNLNRFRCFSAKQQHQLWVVQIATQEATSQQVDFSTTKGSARSASRFVRGTSKSKNGIPNGI